MAWPRARIAWVAGSVVATIAADARRGQPDAARAASPSSPIEHRYAVGIAAVLPVARRAARPSDARRQPRRRAAERRRDLPRDARRDPRREADDHVRDLHLLVGRGGAARSPTRWPSVRAPACACTCCSTGSARSASTSACSRGCATPASRSSNYRPLHWYHLARFNNRTHRKLLVVDGRVGFTGGVGIADKWDGHAEDADHWRDTHYRVEGPVVAQMQATFLDNWTKARGVVLHGDDYFPPLEPRGGDARADVHELARGRHRQHAADVPARDHVGDALDRRSPVAYFVPDELHDATRSSTALKRGVRVRIRRAGADHRHRQSCVARRAPAGASCSRRASRSTSTSRRCSTAR